MAKEFLSQDEVDALLKGVTGEQDDAAADKPEDGQGIRPYNLATQERIVRGRMPTLEIINERFARLLRIGLFNFMRRSAEISVGPVRMQKYSEFIRNLVVPTNLNLVQVKPLRGTAPVHLRSEPRVPGGRQPVRRRRPLPHAASKAAISRRPSSASSSACSASCSRTYEKSWDAGATR